jgi:GDP-mannose 6-dehydrogenase
MTLSVLGLGYVGTVSAACFANHGFRVMGVDINPDKVDSINDRRSPIIEQGLDQLIARSVATGRLQATTDVEQAIQDSDVSLICVGTPSQPDGAPELRHVVRVAEQVGQALARRQGRHTVVLRSTVPPGTTEEVVKPLLERASGLQAGPDFGLCFVPEFLREGNSVSDFHGPPFTLVGMLAEQDARLAREVFGWISAAFLTADVRTAEMVKYVSNCYHALKVAFANEVGRLCAPLKVDAHTVMEIFRRDTRQNLSACYLRPGFAFGGSCLPKDLRTVLHLADSFCVPVEVLAAVMPSNQTQIQSGVELVQAAGHQNVGLLGLAFKAGTDDVRESPLVRLAGLLHSHGYHVRIYDPNVLPARLIGANRRYLERELPDFRELLCESVEEVIDHGETIVVGNAEPAFRQVLRRLPARKRVVDLVRMLAEPAADVGGHGPGW